LWACTFLPPTPTPAPTPPNAELQRECQTDEWESAGLVLRRFHLIRRATPQKRQSLSPSLDIEIYALAEPRPVLAGGLGGRSWRKVFGEGAMATAETQALPWRQATRFYSLPV
jgi:hypothetical protein